MKASQKSQFTGAPKATNTSVSSRKLIGIALILIFIAFIAFGSLVAVDAVKTNHQKDLKAQQDLIADKATFAQAESDMDQAYAEIVAVIGKPAVENKSKTCARSEQKFAYGNMNCGIAYTFAYPEDNVGTSVSRTLKLEDALKGSQYFLGLESQFFPTLNASIDQAKSAHLYIKNKYDLICNVVYEYDMTELQHDNNFNKIKTKYFSSYQFSCSKDVGLPLYTLAQ